MITELFLVTLHKVPVYEQTGDPEWQSTWSQGFPNNFEVYSNYSYHDINYISLISDSEIPK